MSTPNKNNVYQLISRTTNWRLYSNMSQILLLYTEWGYYNKFDSIKSLGVYYWYVKMPRCRCVEHGLEYFFVLCSKTYSTLGSVVLDDGPLGAPAFLKLAYEVSIGAAYCLGPILAPCGQAVSPYRGTTIHKGLQWATSLITQKMTMSWHENGFCITDHLLGESNGHWWITLTEGQLCRSLVFSLRLAWTSSWANNQVVSDLRFYDTHVTSLWWYFSAIGIDMVIFNGCNTVWHIFLQNINQPRLKLLLGEFGGKS